MKRVVISNAYFYPLDKKQWRFKQPYPPLGTLLAAAVVRNLGFEVTFYDTNLEDDPRKTAEKIIGLEPDYVLIFEDGFNYLTKMCLTTMREAAHVLIRAGHTANAVTIVSSSDATDHADLYLAAGADFVIKGEGEQTLQELLTVLDQGKATDSIAGIARKVHGQVVTNPPRAVLRDLDTLPMPAWDLIDIGQYKSIWTKHHGYFSLNIATTRGCPFKCNWCAKPIYGNRYNSRSPEAVVAEIEWLMQHHHPDHFWICDDIFGLKPGWVQRFSTLIAARNLNIRYKIQSRVDLLLEEETVDALAASGAETVWVGAESGSQRILDAMEKGTTIEQIEGATMKLKQRGIRVGHFLQFGYLGEKQEDISATIRMVKRTLPDEIGISVSYPLPGTKFYEKVKSDLSVKSNWKDSDDLDMMFKNTYPALYYKILHRYVHSVHRIKRSMVMLKEWISAPQLISARQLRKIFALAYHIPMSVLRYLELRIIHHASSGR